MFKLGFFSFSKQKNYYKNKIKKKLRVSYFQIENKIKNKLRILSISEFKTKIFFSFLKKKKRKKEDQQLPVMQDKSKVKMVVGMQVKKQNASSVSAFKERGRKRGATEWGVVTFMVQQANTEF